MRARTDIIITIGLILAFLYFARAPLVVVVCSLFFAFMADPIVVGIERLRLPRALAALIAMLVFIAAGYAVVYYSYSRFVSFIDDLPNYLGELRKLIVHVRQKVPLEQITQTAAAPEGSKAIKVEQVSDWTAVFGSVSQITEVFIYAAFVPFISYFMLTWQGHLRAATVALFDNREAADVTLGKIAAMLRRFIVGNVLVALFMGTVSLVVFGILRIPHFYFIAYISGFLSLVPYVGIILAAIPPIAADLGNLHSTAVLAILIAVIALHVFSMNVLYPKFLGRSLELNPFASSLGILFWGWLWGGIGLVLAIPIMGTLKIILDHIGPLKPYAVWIGEEDQEASG